MTQLQHEASEDLAEGYPPVSSGPGSVCSSAIKLGFGWSGTELAFRISCEGFRVVLAGPHQTAVQVV